MVGVELVEDRTTKKPASAAAGFVRRYCLDHGVLIGVGGNFASALRVQPPLVISQPQLDKFFVTIVDGLEAAKKAGVAGQSARPLTGAAPGRGPRPSCCAGRRGRDSRLIARGAQHRGSRPNAGASVHRRRLSPPAGPVRAECFRAGPPDQEPGRGESGRLARCSRSSQAC